VQVNGRLIRLALSCIQPASVEDIGRYIEFALEIGSMPIATELIKQAVEEWEQRGEVVCVHQRQRLYSLTRQGNLHFTLVERKLRDRTRLFLLKELRSAKLSLPEAEELEKADASSAVTTDPALQEERPTVTAENQYDISEDDIRELKAFRVLPLFCPCVGQADPRHADRSSGARLPAHVQ
jgi:hypothetical protein